jgi:hypothetical protein
VAGLSDIPAGNWLFLATISNQIYRQSAGNDYLNDMFCWTALNGVATESDRTFKVLGRERTTDALVLTVPAASVYSVYCLGDGLTLADVRITALPVGTIN